MNQYTHTVPAYFARPAHPITIILVGLGGTGSLMLSRLAKINKALLNLQHPGLQVTAWDPDVVSEANVGRAGFFDADTGLNKAHVLINRVNRSCGFAWEAKPYLFPHKFHQQANIIITCVDNVKARRAVQAVIKHHQDKNGKRYIPKNINYMTDMAYWLDLGNDREKGQAILGTIGALEQPKDLENAIDWLPNVFNEYPDMEKHEEPNTPSCSTAEALLKQDLMINEAMALAGGKIIWDMFRKIRLTTHGTYVNLESMTMNPKPIKNFKFFDDDVKEVLRKTKRNVKKKRGLAALLDREEEGTILGNRVR